MKSKFALDFRKENENLFSDGDMYSFLEKIGNIYEESFERIIKKGKGHLFSRPHLLIPGTYKTLHPGFAGIYEGKNASAIVYSEAWNPKVRDKTVNILTMNFLEQEPLSWPPRFIHRTDKYSLQTIVSSLGLIIVGGLADRLRLKDVPEEFAYFTFRRSAKKLLEDQYVLYTAQKQKMLAEELIIPSTH